MKWKPASANHPGCELARHHPAHAEADLPEARSWYESQRAGLGNELLDEIRRPVNFLETDPVQWPFYYRDFRRLLTRRFPYKLFYRVEGDHVIVFRILHAKRKHQRQL